MSFSGSLWRASRYHIGSWDGYFSFQAERLGASRVSQPIISVGPGPDGSEGRFRLGPRPPGFQSGEQGYNVFDVDSKKLGKFDVVLFLGVLYHLTDPFGGLKKAADMYDECLVVETHSDMNNINEPVMRYYLGRELANDPTNYWGPNAPCLKAMMREIGFTRFESHFFETGVKSTRLFMHGWW